MELESLDNLVNLFNDSSKGTIPNVSLPTPTTRTSVSYSKYSEHSKSVFPPIGSFGHSSFHPNTWKCLSVMECLRHPASFPRSRNKLASIEYYKIAYHKVQYLPPLYNGDVIFELLPSRVFASTSMDDMDTLYEVTL